MIVVGRSRLGHCQIQERKGMALSVRKEKRKYGEEKA